MPQLGWQELLRVSAVVCLFSLLPLILILGLLGGVWLLQKRVETLEQSIKQVKARLEDMAAAEWEQEDENIPS